jgi:4-hydroxybenzoate polyprenyltransferase
MGCNAESAVCAEVIAKHKAAALRFLWRTCGLLLLLSPVWFNGLLAVFAIPMYALTAYILYKLKDEWKRCKLDRRVLYASIMASALASVIVGNIIRSITL